jgi:uncharacterized protein (TIGR03083 family)
LALAPPFRPNGAPVDNEPHAYIAALRNSHERLASLVEAMSEEQLTGQSYDRDWTVAQVLSHLGSGAEIALLMLEATLAGPPMDRELMAAIWDTWNAKSPQQQAADCLPSDEAHVKRLEGLTDAELDGISADFFGMKLDAAGLVRMRLSEHAVHTWDVAVSLDPAAEVAPDAVDLLMVQLPMLAGWTGKADGGPFRLRLRGTEPGADFVLEVADKVTLGAWPGEGAAGATADGQVQMPAEALLRLVYGRLDPGHTPPVEISGDPGLLDRARAALPGL